MNRGAVLGALICGACATASIERPRPIAEIPIEIRHGIPTVNVTVSGEEFHLFVDLGGHQGIALTPTELRRASVRYLDHTEKFTNSAGQVLAARQFVAPSVRVAGFDLGDIEGGESIFGDAAPPDRNGYIGMPALRGFLIVLDYPAKRIRLYRSGDAVAFVSECGDKSFPILAVRGTIQSIVTTEYGEREFIWDTGTTDNFVRPSSLPSGVIGERVDEGPPIVRIDSLKLGAIELGPQQFRLVQFGAPAVDGYLGAGLFQTTRICLDVGEGKGGAREAS